MKKFLALVFITSTVATSSLFGWTLTLNNNTDYQVQFQVQMSSGTWPYTLQPKQLNYTDKYNGCVYKATATTVSTPSYQASADVKLSENQCTNWGFTARFNKANQFVVDKF